MTTSKVVGDGEMSGRQLHEGEPGSPNYEFWRAAAEEVGLNLDGDTVDIRAVQAERTRLVNERRMAPPGDKVWTWQHARAAKLITAICRRHGSETEELVRAGEQLVGDAVRATWVHVAGALQADEVARLEGLAPIIDAHIKELATVV